jgi:hypothetical protein
MTVYTVLTDDEKAQIRIATIRNFEYQMYSFELQKEAELAKTSPSEDHVSFLDLQIAGFAEQIAALQ